MPAFGRSAGPRLRMTLLLPCSPAPCKAAQPSAHSLPPNRTYRRRRGGRDHIWLVSHDEASCYVPAAIRKSIILSHWGRMDAGHTSGSGWGLVRAATRAGARPPPVAPHCLTPGHRLPDPGASQTFAFPCLSSFNTLSLYLQVPRGQLLQGVGAPSGGGRAGAVDSRALWCRLTVGGMPGTAMCTAPV